MLEKLLSVGSFATDLLVFLELNVIDTSKNDANNALFSALWRVAVFIGVLALAYYFTRFIAKSRILRRGANITVLEAVPVSPQSTVQLLKIGDKYFAVGVTKEHISLISEIDKNGLNINSEQEFKEPLTLEKYFSRFVKDKEK